MFLKQKKIQGRIAKTRELTGTFCIFKPLRNIRCIQFVVRKVTTDPLDSDVSSEEDKTGSYVHRSINH